MGFSLDVSVPAITVFVQGLLSFFSPCVLPLLPLYIGYLSGGTAVRREDGSIAYSRRKVMGNTLFFVIGISFAFFLLGLGASAVGTFFHSRQAWFARIGGILVVLFGLYQLGIFGTFRVLGQERRLPLRLDQLAMSPLTALLMGFTFSFAWTPCVGPALTSVLLMAASASARGQGFVLIGVYTLGFVLPFLAVGLFTTSLLAFFKKHRNVVRYTVKLGGALMVAMGLMMFTGKMNDVTGYLSRIGNVGSGVQQEQAGQSDAAEEPEDGGGAETDGAGAKTDAPGNTPGSTAETAASGTGDPADSSDGSDSGDQEGMPEEAEGSQETEAVTLPPSIDFELQDQFGNTHKLSDYKGKTVFLNFWATWCGPCRAEMPAIQKLYETYEQEGDEALIVLGVAAPGWGSETDEEGIRTFLEENGYTYPVVMDPTGELFMAYGVYSFPTTFMIDRDGNVFGYVSGSLTEDMMHSIIEQTMTGVRTGG